MADRVIVVGAKRARQAVPVSEIKQMVGRGGRKHGGPVCKATVICEYELLDDVEQGMNDADSFIVQSSMSDVDSLAFHILPEICNGTVFNEETAVKWFGRSFAHFQNMNPSIKEAFDLLLESEAIEWKGAVLNATPVGRISARLYFHSADVWAWKDNFDMVFNQELENEDAAVAWALGTVPCTRMAGDFGEKYWPVIEQCRNEIPNTLCQVKGTIVTVTLWKYVLGGPSVGKMKSQAFALRGDCGRVCQALKDLNKVMGWGQESFLEELAWRCRRGIPNHLIKLCKLPGITKGKAQYLYDLGMTDQESIALNYDNVYGEVDDIFWRTLRNIANGIF